MIFEPKEGESPVPPENEDATNDAESQVGEIPVITDGTDKPEGRIKYIVGDVEVRVVAQRVQYYGPEGKLITESLKDYTRSAVRKDFASLDAFLRSWTNAQSSAYRHQVCPSAR